MSPSPPQLPPTTAPPVDQVVATLRAAGCVFAEDEARLLITAAPTPADLAAMVARRVTGVPLEHVLGWVEFCGLRIAVDEGVFVPRQRTEFLVRRAAGLAGQADAAAVGHARPVGHAGPRGPVVVDLCCGCGAVGVAIASSLGRIDLHAVDIDPVAVGSARRNVETAGGQVYLGDLYQPLPWSMRGRVDILVANAPYVPTEEIGMMPPEARLYEPLVALDGGADGLELHRRVADGAPQWLAPNGHLLIETSQRQAPTTADIVGRAGLSARVESSDELSATIVIGTRR
jgi:release factor glutamine methyltransferase